MSVPYRQSFAWWSFTEKCAPDQDLLTYAAEIGYAGVDFLPAEYWGKALDLGLDIAIIDGHVSLEVGFNDAANHAALTDEVRVNIELAAGTGCPFIAVNAGNRGAASDEDAARICAEGLAPLAEEALSRGVTMLLEPLNSKIDHIGNQCDSTAWAAGVVDLVGSAGLGLLYDIYHMQVMEGDVLRTMDAHLDRILHLHTAGVPGRHDLDDRQELNWVSIANFLQERGYSGYIAHEFIPKGDPVRALRSAFHTFAAA
ncbi:TIM barrel protein [Nocardia brasiliensis]|uniref:TIM barrel protein n=1 Tax=Nocardia brasiliensis TaxID=37326 RepID=A0A6G9XXG4_NOCBR|nr:TIM barrel protein [Nocardia brasiliensis]QIS05608.1 TIM barrel protein [Nocardia brasiliensis]